MGGEETLVLPPDLAASVTPGLKLAAKRRANAGRVNAGSAEGTWSAGNAVGGAAQQSSKASGEHGGAHAFVKPQRIAAVIPGCRLSVGSFY